MSREKRVTIFTGNHLKVTLIPQQPLLMLSDPVFKTSSLYEIKKKKRKFKGLEKLNYKINSEGIQT